jgi:hypothetical protein
LDDADFDPTAVDDEGLPVVYDEVAIAQFWSTRPGELATRWAKFAAVSVPWLTRLANVFVTGQLEARQRELAADAVDNLEALGPTFLKLAQILSIRCVVVIFRGVGGLGLPLCFVLFFERWPYACVLGSLSLSPSAANTHTTELNQNQTKNITN